MLFYLVTLIILCFAIYGVQPRRNLTSFDIAGENYSRFLSAIDDEGKSRSQDLSPPRTKIHARRVVNPSSLYRKTDVGTVGSENSSTKRFAQFYPKAASAPDSQTSQSYAKGDSYAPAESYHHDDYHKHSSHQTHASHSHHHHHDDHGKGHHFEYALLGLSALAFGSLLLNSLLNLLALGAGFFFGTATGTGIGTGTATSTSTSTGTGGNGGGGVITSTSTSTTSTGTAGSIGGGVGLSLIDAGGISSSGLGLGLNSGLNVAASPANFAINIRKRKRPKRATIHIDVDPFTSFEAMSEFVLNSIEAIKRNHECLPYVLCMGNKRAQVIKKGFQYFIPFYSLCAVYMSKDVGLHDLIPEHIRAILRGLSEANCQSDFQQC